MLYDAITSRAIAAYFSEVYRPVNTIARSLFPIQHKIGIKLAWIKGTKGITPSLAPSAFDTKATLRSRDGISVTETQMPYFKEGIRLSETDRQELLFLGDATNSPLRDRVISEFFDDAAELLRAANYVPERMVYQLLFPENGIPAISFADNGVTYAYTYGDNDWKDGHYTALSGTALWTASSTCDPLKDITALKTKLRMKYGSVIRYLIMNSNTFNLIAKADAVKSLFVLANGNTPNMALLPGQVSDLIDRSTGCIPVINDDVYVDEVGVMQQYVPDGMVAFVPDGPLGTMFRATTPAEADLIGRADVDVSIVDGGVAIATKVETDPVEKVVIASQIVLPSYERIDSVGLLKVIA